MSRRRLLQATAATLALPWVAARASFTPDLGPAPPRPRARRSALLIGNAAYGPAKHRLRGPRADVERLGKALNALGYEVTQVLDAAQAPLRQALASFETTAAASEVAFVFYSGHIGADIGDGGMLLPVDARLDAAKGQPIGCEAGPNVAEVLAVAAKARHGVLVLDTAHPGSAGGALQRQGCSPGERPGLATLLSPNIVLALAASGAGVDGPDGSPYTRALARELARKGQTFNRLFDDVAAAVAPALDPLVGQPLSVNTLQRALPVAAA